MKSIKAVCSCLLLLLLFSPIAPALSIVVKEEPPYAGKNMPGNGLSMEIVQKALQLAGYETKLVFETWPRAYEGAAIGIYDVVGSIWYTEKRTRDFAFSEPYLLHEIKFIKRKSERDIKFTRMDDLDGLIIGTLKDYAYQDAFLQSRQFIRLQQNYLLQNLLLLTQGKIDLALGDVRKIDHELRQYMKGSIKDLEILPTPLIIRGAHIAVSKGNPKHEEIIAGFNKALATMKADGSYQEIFSRHGY